MVADPDLLAVQNRVSWYQSLRRSGIPHSDAVGYAKRLDQYQGNGVLRGLDYIRDGVGGDAVGGLSMDDKFQLAVDVYTQFGAYDIEKGLGLYARARELERP